MSRRVGRGKPPGSSPDSNPSRRTRAKRGATTDEIGVLEAAYRLDGSESEWLEGLLDVAVPLLDEGWGVAATTWNVGSTGVHIREVVVRGGPEGLAEAVRIASANTPITRGIYLSGPCTSLTKAHIERQASTDPASEMIFSLGVRDGLAVVSPDLSGFCTGLTAYRPDRAVPSRRFVSRWSRVASHLSAGFRLRRQIQAANGARPDPLSGSEAIFNSAGRLEHAEGPARRAHQLLARSVLAIDRARGDLRAHDPDAALDSWKGLVAGRWSLVDHVDTDGKRFLVARKNDPSLAVPTAVTVRERQLLAARARGLSIKLIAYDLGLSNGTVSRGLHAGMLKLGIANEAELVPLFGPAIVKTK